MKIFYRISESTSSVHNNKLSNATKQKCLLNAIECFKNSEIIVFVDHVSDSMWLWLNTLESVKLEKIQAGSESKSMRILLNAAMALKENDVIMFLEDDYLHLPGSERALIDAIKYADYATCYLHPDKFWHPGHGGNVYTTDDNISETTKIIKTTNHFWMLTNSTTCTFATTVNTLKQDIDVWLDGTCDPFGTHDFEIFLKLRERGRKLLQPIPSLATHCLKGFEAPLTGLNIKSWEEI